ncbi:MAG: efflux RND transporter periplasmic adaptor subunit [Planctomycetaceae bacterium]|jgi:HlyD family secretion protein|nr:efflux RND transporter periplasmic adaptor subunit [Planctomycetaceae bacterium]MBT6153095.1 efflux RND transporter periplasmic adaptor subunit [Planctomycetaceae bacterium]MBT6484890.1 efflux RND transporter periplasmic adaptor subunit [Planctomycetaceae bacterium]MBT6495215.1 efflux RND transporter periplasmic adaptor subunit [Planctomycetaceae bacterium]
MICSRSSSKLLSAAACWSLIALVGCTRPAPVGENKTQPKPVRVKTVSVTSEEVEQTTTQPATVHPFYRAEVRAKTSGYVETVEADIGDYVEAGDTLAIIDVPELQQRKKIINARITRHVAGESRAKSGVELAKANVVSATAKLAQANSELKRAEAMLTAAEAEFTRTEDLVARKSLESRVLDEVRKKRDAELANQAAVTSAITSANADVAVAKAQQSAAEADLDIAEAETEIVRQQLAELAVLNDYATIEAPFAGVVTQRSVDPGDLVRESSEVGKGEPLFVVSQMTTVRVHIPIPEADAALVSKGDTVTLTFPSFSAEEPIKIPVTRLSGELDPSTRTMLVEVEVENATRKLLPGMFGQATISLSSKIAANMLPARAVRFDETGEAYVYLVDENDTVSVVQVTTGIDDGHSIQILTGLQAGQQVVDAHLKRFTAEQKVTVLSD